METMEADVGGPDPSPIRLNRDHPGGGPPSPGSSALQTLIAQSALRSQDPTRENPSGLSSPGSRFGSNPSPSSPNPEQIPGSKLYQLEDKSFEVQNQLEVEMLNLQNMPLENTAERS